MRRAEKLVRQAVDLRHGREQTSGGDDGHTGIESDGPVQERASY